MSLELIEQHRGISVETLKDCGLWWNESDSNYPVVVPYYHVGGKWYDRRLWRPGLDRPDDQAKALSPKNVDHQADSHLYNPLELGPNASLVFICEGEYDTLSVIDCGYPAVGSQGTHTFKAVWARLFSGALVIIAFDDDKEGTTASEKLRKYFRLLGNRAYILGRDKGRDLNDYHKLGQLDDLLDDYMFDNELTGEN
ncbi:hypothetical protein LCGC14_1490300 [marine sediment metagenome]|uniref:Toprim domain-containing protein n=1 Tax=marine sediment metagenome TaxID=412755 RepID=A0A0F9LMF4_9ZZZZ